MILKGINFMEFHVPHYYNDFVCIADKCIDNCCFGGWVTKQLQ